MNKVIMLESVFLVLVLAVGCQAVSCKKSAASQCQVKKTDVQPAKVDAIDEVLARLAEQNEKLESYQCRLEYLVSQPLFESQSLRKGRLYYQKSGAGRTALRLNFQTLQQDDDDEQEYIEQYIFDGVWLRIIDYQIKEVRHYQLAEVNEPVDAFELLSRKFPLVGFSKAEELKKDFEISLIEQKQSETAEFIQLHLKVRANSVYKDDYTFIDFWVDKKTSLPAKIVAVSSEKDIYEFKFSDVRVNKKIDKKIFKVKVPKGFGESFEPLKKAEQKHKN